MTNEQKERIVKLCEGKEGIGWPDDVFFGGDSRETLKYSGWEGGRCPGWQLVRYGSEKREAQWDLAESHFIRWREDRLIEAGCEIERYKAKTIVFWENPTENTLARFKDYEGNDDLDALLTAAETEGVLK